MSLPQLVENFRTRYADAPISYFDFIDILGEFSQIDPRCALEPDVQREFYNFLSQKQNGLVSYSSIELLIFEFLVQQPKEVPQLRIQVEQLGPKAKLIPLESLTQLTPDFIKDLTNFYKLSISKLAVKQDEQFKFKDLEKLGKDLSSQFHIDTQPILQFLSVLVDSNGSINSRDITQLITELERALYQAQKERISIRQSLIGPPTQKVQSSNILNSSSDEGQSIKSKSGFSSVDTSVLDDLKEQEYTNTQKIQHYTNQLLQRIDLLKQSKYIEKIPYGQQTFNEMIKIVQKIDIKMGEMQNLLDERFKERTHLEQVKSRRVGGIKMNFLKLIKKKMRFEQLKQMLDDNDILSNQLNVQDQQLSNMKQQLDGLLKESRTLTELESGLRAKQIEVDMLKDKQIAYQKEILRLNENNKLLLENINELEIESSNGPVKRNSIIEEGKKNQELLLREIENLQFQLYEQQQQISSYEEKNLEFKQNIEKLESLLGEAKRDANYYRNQYENSQQDVVQLRTSLLMRQKKPSISNNNQNFNFGKTSLLPKRISNMGMFNFGRNSFLNRPSNRISFVYDQAMKTNNFNQLEPEQPQEIQTITEEPEQQLNQIQIPENDEINESKLVVDFADFWDKHHQNQTDISVNGKLPEDYKPDFNFVQFDETLLYASDYMGLRDDSKVSDLLTKERQKHGKQLIKCYSDQVFRIDHKGQKARRVLFVTEFNIYIFENEKDLKLTRQFPIEKLVKVIFSETSPILCCLVIKGSDDYLIETFKRTELNSFMTDVMGLRKLDLYELEFKTSFLVQFKGIKQAKRIDDIAKGAYISGSKQAAFKISQQQGFLLMFSKQGWFSKEWKEFFIILCEVGLIIFEKPGDMVPKLFVPLVEAMIIKNPKNVQLVRQNMFKISYQTQDLEFLFSTASAALLDQWYDSIHIAINDLQKKQNKLQGLQRTELESLRSTVHSSLTDGKSY